MHFKKLVAYVLRKIVAHELKLISNKVTPKNILDYIEGLKGYKCSIPETVQCIFHILFDGNDPKHREVFDFVIC